MFSSSDYLILPIIACIAAGLDFVFGEPKRYHPLVGFGLLAKIIENKLNREKSWTQPFHRMAGLLGLLLLLTPFVLLALTLNQTPIVGTVTNVLFLYFALGHKSLHEHAYAVQNALNKSDIINAKTAASYMVSRDSAAIEPVPATIESILENGNDGVFGALFWLFVAGGTGALAFRLINTMDAMWGYKNKRYYYFGWAAARLDDAANYLPTRLTALTYAFLGHTKKALRCWRQQAPLWDSPNAGSVMASGAGALSIQLGGPACYQGEWHDRPILGTGKQAVASDIDRALKLVQLGVFGWLSIAAIVSTILAWCYA